MGIGYLASSRQYGNALLGVRHQEEEEEGELIARRTEKSHSNCRF